MRDHSFGGRRERDGAVATQRRGVRTVPISGLTVPPKGYAVDNSVYGHPTQHITDLFPGEPGSTPPPAVEDDGYIQPKPGLIFGDCDYGFGLSMVIAVYSHGTVLAVNANGDIRTVKWEDLDHAAEHMPQAGWLFDQMAPRIAELFSEFEETKPFGAGKGGGK